MCLKSLKKLSDLNSYNIVDFKNYYFFTNKTDLVEYSIWYFLAPRLITKNLSAIVEDLEYCTKYNFAVTVINDVNSGSVTINPNNIRSIITLIDPEARPKNLHVDYEPLEAPCLVIKWSASCPNVGHPIGYVVSILCKLLKQIQHKTMQSNLLLFHIFFKVVFSVHIVCLSSRQRWFGGRSFPSSLICICSF